MERLVKYTTRLVAQHNCVIIPGLGAFLAHNVSASYNMEASTFMPPHRALGFNPQVIIDDALLVSEYIYAEQFSYDEASKMLREDVATLRRELSAKGLVHFGELGTFSINVTGKITFDQAPNGIDDPYNFGFEPLTIQQLKEIEKKEIIIKRSTFKRAIASVAAIILMFFFVSPIGDSAYEPSATAGFVTSNNTKTQKPAIQIEAAPTENRCEIAPVTNTVTEKIITENIVLPAAEEAKATTNVSAVPVAEKIITSNTINAQTTAQSCDKATETKRYSVIVASTPNEQKAQLAIEELSAKAEAEYTVVQAGGRHRIAYGTYDSNKEATDALAGVKAIFPDAWIFTH